MCTYNGCRVSRADFIRLRNIEKELKNLRLNIPAQNGFDYRDWPVIKPLAGGKDFEIKSTVDFRNNFIWNTLLVNINLNFFYDQQNML